VGSKDSLVSLWRLDELLPLRTLGSHATALRSLSFSPCGTMVNSSHPMQPATTPNTLELYLNLSLSLELKP
jgi:WD40 repeat protein